MRELRLEVPVGATVDDAWDAVVGTVPALAPGRASLRFAVNGAYADPDTTARRRRRGRLHPAGERRVRRRPACGSSRSTRRRSRPTSSSTLGERLATDEDGGVVTFVGRTRVTPGTPAPGQEAEAARHAGRRVDELEYEAFEPMAVRVLDEIADEIEARFGGPRGSRSSTARAPCRWARRR